MEKLHCNDLIYNSFGPNKNCRHKNTKALFDRQKNLVKPPPKT